MDAFRWKQVQAIFHEAVELGGYERAAFVSLACQDDEDLRHSVEQLLASDDSASTILVQLASAAGALLSEPDDSAEFLPEDLGLYRFTSRIGQGGMGVVYKAEHRETGQIVAIKVLRAGDLSATGRYRFATEQKALARLNHPLIARLFSSETFRDGTPCFVMEYVEGEPVTVYCRQQAYSLRQRLTLFRQICEAVRHAHDHGVIHRDLKPSNIFVKNDGTIRLLDFGIAKQLDEQGEPLDLTTTIQAPMTVAYAAPEQILGEPAGPHTDVYALGVILYELLTERAPFKLNGLTPGELEAAIRFQTPERPSRVRQGTLMHNGVGPQDGRPIGIDREKRFTATDWSDLDLLCQTALHKDAGRRYRSIEALMRDLDRWMLNQPLEAHRDTATYRFIKFWHRNRRLLTAVAMVLVVSMAAAIWFTVRLAKARNEAVTEQLRTQRVERFVLALFDGGDPATGPSKSATALTMLDRGAKQAAALQSDRGFQAELYTVLGGLYDNLGKFDQANGLLEAALQQTASKNSRAETLVALAALRSGQSKLTDAERLVRQALDLEQREPAASSQAIARAEALLGDVLSRRRQPDAAVPFLNRALALQRSADGVHSDLGVTLMSLAGVRQEQGRYDEAVSLNQQALAMDREVYGDLHPRVAEDYTSLGSVHLLEDRYAEAEQEYRHALDVDLSWYGEENPQTIETSLTLGQTLIGEHRYAEARQLLIRTLAVARRALGDKSQLGVFALNALGTLEQNTNNLQAAEGYFQQVLNDAKALFGRNSDVAGITLSNLGTLYEKEGQHQRAADLFQQAAGVLRGVYPPSHPQLAKLQFNLGKALFGAARYREAKQHLEESLLQFGKQPKPPTQLVEQARHILLQIDSRHQAKPKTSTRPS